MPSYVITRNTNGREYYLENIYHDKVVWITNKEQALSFGHEGKLKDFISKEFPGKDYYVSEYRDPDDWGIIIKPTGLT